MSYMPQGYPLWAILEDDEGLFTTLVVGWRISGDAVLMVTENGVRKSAYKCFVDKEEVDNFIHVVELR